MKRRMGALHLVCGKIAAGKSTLCAQLAAAPGAVQISEDFWLKRLFGDEMKTVADYIRVSAKLRTAMGPHVTALLKAGADVVLDFPANTAKTRAWMKGLADDAGAPHLLYWLDVPDETCRARLRQRNAEGKHDFAGVTDEQFDLHQPLRAAGAGGGAANGAGAGGLACRHERGPTNADEVRRLNNRASDTNGDRGRRG
jgi:predicted kinase